MNNEFSISNQFEQAAKDIRQNLPPRKPQQPRQPQPQVRQPIYQQPQPQPPYRQPYQQPRVPLQPQPTYQPIPFEDKLKKWSFIVLVGLVLLTAGVIVLKELIGRF